MRSRIAIALFAGWFTACDAASSPQCAPSDLDASAATGVVVLGEIDTGRFVSFDDDPQARLVLGTQGGWMLLVAVGLPPEWLDEPCIELSVMARFQDDDEWLAPVSLRVGPEPGGPAHVGPVPILLGFDADELVGRVVRLRVMASSGRATAEAEAEAAVHRDAS